MGASKRTYRNDDIAREAIARLGRVLRILQGKRSQRQFAREIGLSSATMCRMMRGEKAPDFEHFVYVCIRLNLNANEIIKP